MTIKMTGCMKLINSMSEEDQSALVDRLDAYMADGVPAKEAQRMAAADTLAEIESERTEMMGHVREQHADLVSEKDMQISDTAQDRHGSPLGDQTLLTALKSVKTVGEALRIARDLPNVTDSQRAVLDRLAAMPNVAGMGFTLGKEKPHRKVFVRGSFRPYENSINLNFTGDVPTLIHEAVHASTLFALTDHFGNDANGKNVGEYTNPITPLGRELVDLFKKVKAELPTSRAFYAMTDVAEFLAEANANASFQAALKAIPVESKKSATAWDAFKDWVRRLLAIPVAGRSALDQALDLTQKLEDENAGAQARGDWRMGDEADLQTEGVPNMPEQVSADHVTEEQRRHMSAVFGNADTRGLKDKAKDKAKGFMGWVRDRSVQAIFDQFAPIKKLSQRAYMLARMSTASDGTLLATMVYGKPYVDENGAANVRLSPEDSFVSIMSDLKGEGQLFLRWIAAKRAEELMALSKENLMTPEDIAALKSLDRGTMKDGRSRAEVYARNEAKLAALNDAVVKIAVDSGLIDEGLRRMWEGHPYVPFWRMLDDGPVGPTYSSALTGQDGWKRLTGGTSILRSDLMESVLQNWAHVMEAAGKNRAALATLDAAMELGVDERGVPVVERVPVRAKDSVRVMRNGQAEYYFINDPYLAEAVSAMHYALPEFMKPLASFKRMLTVGITSTPAFKLRNLIRDTLQSVALSDLDPNVFKNMAAGFKTTDVAGAARNLAAALVGRANSTLMPMNQTYASMVASGGVMRFASGVEGSRSHHAQQMIRRVMGKAVMLDESGAKKLLHHMADVVEAYNELGDTSEQVNRVALYERLIAKGHSHAEASFMARDLLDFSLSGKAPVIRFLINTVPFLNARLQGLYKLGRAGAENPKRAGAVVGAMTVAGLALYLAYKDDDDWKRREDWDRDAYYWFKIGDKAYRLPKAFETGAIASIAERTWELMFDKEMTLRRYGDRIGSMLADNLSFNPTPQIVKPLIDVYANKDSFTGRPIEGAGMERLRPQDRYDENTSMLARGLGALGLVPNPTELLKGNFQPLSPKQLDFVMRGYFGTLASFTNGIIDQAAAPLAGKGMRPTPSLKSVSLGFADDLPADQSRYVTVLYDRAREVDQLWGSYQHALKLGDREKALAIVADNPGLAGMRKAVDGAKERLGKLNEDIKRVDASTSLSAESKRSLLDSLRAKRAAIAEAVEQRLPAY